MIITKDGYEVRVGDWLEDACGLWEIREIGQFVTEREAFILEDGSVEYGIFRYLTPEEVKQQTYA